ncbi:MAG: pentapeptide repeat-containing protein [Gammaproteobacteria bacterium]|nr:MAG: pentapeptide repeat-containing protein [Gammaproteobacteria bacterium]
MDKNFAGQNLNGRSFRGQDLRGADFSGCQLKSCDFREADLTDAKFCRATLGVDGWRKLVKWGADFVLGIACGFLAWFVIFIFAFTSDEIYRDLNGDKISLEGSSYVFLLTGLLSTAGACLTVFAALEDRDWRIVVRYCSLGILVSIAVGAVENGVVVILIALTLTLTVGGMLVTAVAVAGVGAGAVAVAVVFAVAAETEARAMATIAEATMLAVMAFIYFLLGWYLNYRTLLSEEPMLAWLRRYALAWRCWGGTKFFRATLAHTDFTEADLTAARFAGAKFRQPSFIHAKNLHLAWTYASPLEHKQVRTLLTESRNGWDRWNFSNPYNRYFFNLKLRGLSFKGLDLSYCSFCRADLSEADFSNCDLTDADFSEAMVYGARFSNAKMTGAIIDKWGMDKRTQFDGVICDFVYTKRNREERNPPQGDFKPGEFSKLYQEIANTVDFIAHTPDELTALLRAIDSIKQQGGDIVIQSLERKNESVVVRTQSDESIDKAAIYAEVKAQTEKELLVLQQEKQLLLQKVELQEQQADTLKQFLKLAIESPKTMNDNSRHYSNITAHNSAVNLGDASTVSNHIKQVADAELKAALQTLQQLLADSHLSDIDKQQAHQAVDDLAVVSQKPQAERKSLARRSLSFLKDLQQDLSSVAELGEQYGKLLIKVMAWF